MTPKRWNVGVGIIGLSFAMSSGVAQTRAIARAPLTVRPHAMATGTANPATGIYPLDTMPEVTPELDESPYLVYVPPQCVGARRCPLVLYLHGAGGNSNGALHDYRAVADKYGIIVLAATARQRLWAVGVADSFPLDQFEPDRKNLDAALQQTLRKFAIDPDKIVISCVSQGCWPTMMLGGTNLGVFSRVVTFGWLPQLKSLDPPTQTTEFLAIGEFFPGSAASVWRERDLRRAGYRAKQIAAFAGHGVYPTHADFVGQWLRESWAQSDPAKRPAPRVIDPPVLTPQALTQMAAMQGGIGGKPTDEQSLACTRETVVPVVAERLSTVMIDMSAAAAKIPAVAAALEKIGLTAEQFDAYRVALTSARFVSDLAETHQLPPGTVIDSTSVLGQNMALVKAHPEAMKELSWLFSFPLAPLTWGQ